VGVPKTALVTKMETAQASCQGIVAQDRGLALEIQKHTKMRKEREMMII
jgi:hypothetical protein